MSNDERAKLDAILETLERLQMSQEVAASERQRIFRSIQQAGDGVDSSVGCDRETLSAIRGGDSGAWALAQIGNIVANGYGIAGSEIELFRSADNVLF